MIDLTVPLILNGKTICDFEASIEVKVTVPYTPARISIPEDSIPAEGPEWEVEAMYVHSPGEDSEEVEVGGNGSIFAEAIYNYQATQVGGDLIAQAIIEGDYE